MAILRKMGHKPILRKMPPWCAMPTFHPTRTAPGRGTRLHLTPAGASQAWCGQRDQVPAGMPAGRETLCAKYRRALEGARVRNLTLEQDE